MSLELYFFFRYPYKNAFINIYLFYLYFKFLLFLFFTELQLLIVYVDFCHFLIDFMDFVVETNVAQKLLYDVEGFFYKVICHINNSLHSGYFFYLKTVSVNPELDDSSCKMISSAVITLDINNQTERTSKR